MADEAHIGFVDTHAESDRRHHDDSLVGNELVLMGVTCAAVETGVIGKRIEAGLAQLPRQAVRFLTRPAIDDAGVAGMVARNCRTWRNPGRRRSTRCDRFGRSNEPANTRGAVRNRWSMISARVGGAAVAVTATIWRTPIASAALRKLRYSGRKSCPQW